MPKINIVIIHGIGNQQEGYAKLLVRGLTAEFTRQVNSLLKVSSDYSQQLQIKEILWGDILGENQAKLKAILQDVHNGNIRQKNLFRWINLKISSLRTSIATEFIGDILGYQNKKTTDKIHQRILDGITSLSASGEKENITFISHSLGTVISSDFIYEQQKTNDAMRYKFQLNNFFTLGSPLALFSLRYGQDMFTKPIMIEEPHGRWINIYDKDDPIAYRLKPLNDAYDKAVLKDLEVDTGIFGFAHVRYWKNKAVHNAIGRKLALDWIRLNNKLDDKVISRPYQDYDKI